MSDLFDVVKACPLMTFFVIFVLAVLTYGLVEAVFTTPIRLYLRNCNIKAQGWPPPHCDADGDLVTVEEEEDDDDGE